MSNKTVLKPLSAALGAAFVTSLSAASVANAGENPFAMSELSGGYMVAEAQEGHVLAMAGHLTQAQHLAVEGQAAFQAADLDNGVAEAGQAHAR